MFRAPILLLLITLGAAGSSADQRSGTGSDLEQISPARRIVALAPDIVENLFALGAGDLLVGRVASSNYPREALSIPLVGDYQRLNVEAILARKPDLVFAWLEGNPPDQLRRLERFGLNVIRLSTTRIDDIPHNLRLMGQLTGMEAEAERQATLFEKRLRVLKPVSGGHTPTLFYQLWSNPLMTVNDNTLIGQAISFCGAYNPFGGQREPAPQVGVESVIAAQPELIVATDEEGEGWQKRWLEWPLVPAVDKGAFYTLKADHLHRATPRFLEGLEGLCSAVSRARSAAQE